MIDFQNGGLESQVYELIAKMCDLTMSDDFPKFQTKQLRDGLWECSLNILGVKNTAFGRGETEVKSINNCAHSMLQILKSKHKNDEYDPDIEESVFREHIEQYFGNIKYNPEYNYYVNISDILLCEGRDDYIRNILMKYAVENLRPCIEQGHEVDMMCDIVTLKFLIRRRKNNYA